VAAEHSTKIYAVALSSVIVVIAFLAFTSTGHVIDAATQHFMLFYAGVFALIGLCASVGLGLVATDRVFLTAGRRVFIQSAHRAASFGAVTFLVIHIITEILAQRVHVIDAVIPFLSPFRTFYIGLGTIASDLVILIVITGILRGRFNANGKAWRWRAIHYTSYLSFVFGVWHGLLAGRTGKPYVDWSYGFVVAFVLLGLVVRVFSNSLKPKENLSAPPTGESATSASAPLRAAAMFAQVSMARGGRYGGYGAVTGGQPVLPAPVNAPVLTALPAAGALQPGQPYYEPGYEGPPRYLGAPRSSTTGPHPRVTGAQPRITGSQPRITGAQPRVTEPQSRVTGSQPRITGSQPRITGSQPRATGPQSRVTGPLSRSTGPLPAAGPWSADTGPLPPHPSGPLTRFNGPVPYPNGSLPRGAGVLPPHPSGPLPRATGPLPPAPAGSLWSGDNTWEQSWPEPGPGSRAATGPQPRAGGDPYPRPAAGSRPHPGTLPGHSRPGPRPAARPGWDTPPSPGYDSTAFDSTALDRTVSWPSYSRPATDDEGWYPAEPPWDGGFADTDPNLKYREPGPGMPGYRGSRENRYGGDRR
jgi:DMSO/TMAO reductase YedYZ heme-binding membrane subunit